MPLVTTFEQACEAKGYNPEIVLPVVTGMPEELQAPIIAAAKAFIIVDVLNDGWIPNYDDYNEEKWELWYWLNKPGFRLDVVGYVSTGTHAGARLVFKDKARARHMDKHFRDIMQVLYTKK